MWEITLDPKDSFSNTAQMPLNTVSGLVVLCATLTYYITGCTGLNFYIHNIINVQFIAGLWFYTAVIFKDFILF